jgi:uncharacterized protein (TIGR02996 family)
MNEETALLAAIRAQPEDDTARLVYADWLQEHDHAARAEFIRVQIDLARSGRLVTPRPAWCDPRWLDPAQTMEATVPTEGGFLSVVSYTFASPHPVHLNLSLRQLGDSHVQAQRTVRTAGGRDPGLQHAGETEAQGREAEGGPNAKAALNWGTGNRAENDAARIYKATASFPWSDSPPRDDVVY